jgi:ribokinase
VRMLLALGDDDAARPLEASLQAAGVQMEIVRVAGEATGCAFICLSDQAENAITVAPGANAALRGEHLPSLEGVSHLLLQLETPIETVAAYASKARAAGVKVVLNAAPAQSLPRDLLAAVDVLIVNEGELRVIAGAEVDTSNLQRALSRLTVPCVVVTLGAGGCYALQQGNLFHQPAFPIQAVDTTAAGDTFCGVLAAVLSQGCALPEALLRASAAAALTCTRLGAQASIPTRAEVDTLIDLHATTTPA